MKERPFPVVHVDDIAIARMAAEHLLERGFRQFGFVAHANERCRTIVSTRSPTQSARHGYECNVLQADDLHEIPKHGTNSSKNLPRGSARSRNRWG